MVEDNGTSRWYIDASHYYNGESSVNDITTLSEKGYRIGQAVNYHPSDNVGYATETEVETGVIVQADTYPEDTIWRILSVNDSTGVIKITPGTVNGGQVTLSGEGVYFNSAQVLDEICNALYKNDDLTLPVTCMTYEEINYAAGDYHPSATQSTLAYYNVAYFPNDATVSVINSGDILLGREDYFVVSSDTNTITVNENGTLVTYTKKAHGSNTYAFYTGNGIVMYGGRQGEQVNNRDCLEPYKDNNNKYHPIFVRTTGVNYMPSDDDHEPLLFDVLGFSSGWLASSCVNATSGTSNVFFSVWSVSAFGLSRGNVASSNGGWVAPSNGLLPVVTLNASRLTNTGSNPSSSADPGSDENPWGIK